MSVAGPSLDLLLLLSLMAGLAAGAADGGVAAGLLRTAGVGRAWLAAPMMGALAAIPILLASVPDPGALAAVWAAPPLAMERLIWLIVALAAAVVALAFAGVPVPSAPALGLALVAAGGADPMLLGALGWGGAGLAIAAVSALVGRALAVPETLPARAARRRVVTLSGVTGAAAALAIGLSVVPAPLIATALALPVGLWIAWYMAERTMGRSGQTAALARAGLLAALAVALVAVPVQALMVGRALAALSPQPPSAVWPTISLGLVVGVVAGAALAGGPVARMVHRLAGGAGAAGAALVGAAILLGLASGLPFGAIAAAPVAALLAFWLTRDARPARAAAVLAVQLLALGAAVAAGYALSAL